MGRRKSSLRRRLRLDRLACNTIVVVAAFYAGILVGMHTTAAGQTHDFTRLPEFDRAVRARVQALAKQRRDIQEEEHHHNTGSHLRFGEGTARYAMGAARIPKQDFLDTFDSGFPADQRDDPYASEVLILYNNKRALPYMRTEETTMGDTPKLTALDATQNCHALHVMSTHAGNAMPQCIAIVPHQYESFHVQRWMRIDPPSPVSGRLPLIPVGRGQMSKGVNQFSPPRQHAVQVHQRQLQRLFQHKDAILKELRPHLKKIAVNNTVVVMVCNQGQADLLANFACASKARGFSVSNVLVFCTDEETYRIATQLGLKTYYNDKLFADVSQKEAQTYGDKAFQDLMYAKAVTVQLVNWLGYDLLFQDVDVVWYKNPLPYLQSSFLDFDVLFQDDGARSLRYAPYSANSGFYYVRYNARTRHLLTSMLYVGDTIISSGSHQQALASLLAEYSSLYGLRVKTLDSRDFPGGYTFHREPHVMHEIVKQSLVPFVFHASWTENKANKIKFLQQMGLWYNDDGHGCSAEPIVQCHYRDKPSMIPCHDSPPLDRDKPSFWT